MDLENLENLENETFTDEVTTESDIVSDMKVEEVNEEIQEVVEEAPKEVEETPKEVEKTPKRKKKESKKKVEEVFSDTEKENKYNQESQDFMSKVEEEIQTNAPAIFDNLLKEKFTELLENQKEKNGISETSIDTASALNKMKEVSNKTNKDSKKILNTLAKFTVTQVLTSKKYVRHRDFLRSILDAEKTYSHSEVEKIIDDFKKGKVD